MKYLIKTVNGVIFLARNITKAKQKLGLGVSKNVKSGRVK